MSRSERAWHCHHPKNGFRLSPLKPLPCAVKTNVAKKISLSFSINGTHTLSYQSLHTASLLTNSVSVLTELQAGWYSIDQPLFMTERQVQCHQKPDVTAGTGRRNHKHRQEERENCPISRQLWTWTCCNNVTRGCPSSKSLSYYNCPLCEGKSLQDKEHCDLASLCSVHHILLFCISEVCSISQKIMMVSLMVKRLADFHFPWTRLTLILSIVVFPEQSCCAPKHFYLPTYILINYVVAVVVYRKSILSHCMTSSLLLSNILCSNIMTYKMVIYEFSIAFYTSLFSLVWKFRDLISSTVGTEWAILEGVTRGFDWNELDNCTMNNYVGKWKSGDSLHICAWQEIKKKAQALNYPLCSHCAKSIHKI